MPQHNDSCTCQISHKDYVTADGIRNLATYEIDSHCYTNGIRANEGMMWIIMWDEPIHSFELEKIAAQKLRNEVTA